MSTSINKNHTFSTLAKDIKINDEMLTVYLEDGRIISIPLAYFPTLMNASPEQKNKWRLIGRGQGICWEDIDEALSVEGLLRVM